MPWFQFFWTEENIQHLADHGVTPEQFETAVMHAETNEWSRSTGRPAIRGRDDTGRMLFCVYEWVEEDVTIYPITAYEVHDGE